MIVELNGMTILNKREEHKHRINIRTKLWEEQNHICEYCKCEILKEEASLEHIIPVVHLHNNIGEDNLVVICKQCNYNKGNHIIFFNLR